MISSMLAKLDQRREDTPNLIAHSIISFRQLPFDIDWKFIVKAVMSSLIMSAIVWVLNPTGAVNILISIVAGAVTYFMVLALLRGFTRQEYSFFRGILGGVKR